MKYYLAGLTAFILWGFSSLAVKPLSGYASPDILFYRVAFSLALILVINMFFRRDVVRRDYRKYRSMDPGMRKRVVPDFQLVFLYFPDQSYQRKGCFLCLPGLPHRDDVTGAYLFKREAGPLAMGCGSDECIRLLAIIAWALGGCFI